MSGLDHAVQSLRQAVESPRRHRMWRWLVRHRLAAVEGAVRETGLTGGEAWLASREMCLRREQAELLVECATCSRLLREDGDLHTADLALRRLLTRLDRHRQRLHDLVYDSVSLDLGGSE